MTINKKNTVSSKCFIDRVFTFSIIRGMNKALKKAGGYSGLAKYLGISRQRVHNWFMEGGQVPAHFVIDVEKATGVSRYEIRPDVFGVDPRREISSTLKVPGQRVRTS
jgi:DNA-binding transcriptional regulator YdaS (Cro superfamily)